MGNSEGLGLVSYLLEIWKLEYRNHMRNKYCAKRHVHGVIVRSSSLYPWTEFIDYIHEVLVYIHGFGAQKFAGCGCERVT